MITNEDVLCCKLCYNLFKDPVKLPCGHSLCLSCAETLYSFQILKNPIISSIKSNDKNKIKDTKKKGFKCPTCSTSIDIIGIDSLPKDYNLREIIEGNKKNTILCDNECSSIAILDCKDCKCSYCEKCFVSVHSLKALSKHQKLDLGESKKLYQCSKHKNDLQLYCIKCNQMICLMCQYGEHKGHEVLPIIDYADICKNDVIKEKENIKLIHNQLKESKNKVINTISELNEIHDKFGVDLDSFIEKLHKLLDERKVKLLDKSESIRKIKLISLKEQETALNSIIEKLDEILILTEKKINHNPYELSHLKQSLTSIIEKSFKEDLLLEPQHKSKPFISLSLKGTEKLFNSLGIISEFQPDPPIFSNITSSSIQLNWKDSLSKDFLISNYILEMKQSNEIDFKKVYSGSNLQFTINNLQKDTFYHFRLFVVTESGESLESPITTVKTNKFREFHFQSTFDQNGLLYWIGTNEGTSNQFTNPATTGKITVTRSSEGYGKAEDAAGRQCVHCCTNNIPNSWYSFDLGENNSIIPNYYSLRHDNYPSYVLRSWNLEGSNDNMNWQILKEHRGDDSLQEIAGSSASWPLPNLKVPYRYLRVLQTGPNSSNSYHLILSGFEVYGTLQK